MYLVVALHTELHVANQGIFGDARNTENCLTSFFLYIFNKKCWLISKIEYNSLDHIINTFAHLIRLKMSINIQKKSIENRI